MITFCNTSLLQVWEVNKYFLYLSVEKYFIYSFFIQVILATFCPLLLLSENFVPLRPEKEPESNDNDNKAVQVQFQKDSKLENGKGIHLTIAESEPETEAFQKSAKKYEST